MNVDLVPIDSITPYARNPRRNNEQAVDKVAASIHEFGWRVPIVVDEANVIVCGHTRHLAARKLGLEYIAVHRAIGLTPAQIKAYRLMDNRSHQDSNWDEELLGLELEDLKGLDYDLSLTGFEVEELGDYLGQEHEDTPTEQADFIPEPPAESVTRLGDVWVLGAHRIVCGDVRARETWTKLLASDHQTPKVCERVQMCITSPPYWGLRDYGTAQWEGGHDACEHIEMASGMSEKNTLGRPEQGGMTPANAANIGRVRQFKHACPKCGARRIDAQLGLEATPEEWTANLVEVFGRVKDALADDATCWINCGDSFRDKQLLGQPWRLAFALQQPYYTGRLKRIEDRIWLAAMLEAEGCMFIHKRKEGQNNGQGYQRQHDNYAPGIEIANTSKLIIDRVMALAGKGSVCTQGPDENARRKQVIYRWNLRTTECREFVGELYPHLVGKQQQARILCGCPSSGEKAEAAHVALMGLHQGIETAIDFPAPASLYEPGFFLRSEIIWSKLNPMPESCTDRPTKAHEQLFLLSKKADYYYDAEAVREPALNTGGNGEWGGRGDSVRNPAERMDLPKVAMGEAVGRNRRDVWPIATQPTPAAHFATYPCKLIEPAILAGTSERGHCPACGRGWVRVTEVRPEYQDVLDSGKAWRDDKGKPDGFINRQIKGHVSQVPQKNKTTGWRPACECANGVETPSFHERIPALILDPFLGAGTTTVVAEQTGRACCGIELNPAYCDIAIRRFQRLFDVPATLEGDGRTFDAVAVERVGTSVPPTPQLPGKPRPELDGCTSWSTRDATPRARP